MEFASAWDALSATYARDKEIIAQSVKQVLPKRRQLQVLMSHLDSQLHFARGRVLPAALASLTVLLSDPLTITLATRIACGALAFDALAKFIEDNEHQLHAEAIAIAAASIATSNRIDIAQIVVLEER
jgi:hypothetical protein